jgi:hypothetical protein
VVSGQELYSPGYDGCLRDVAQSVIGDHLQVCPVVRLRLVRTRASFLPPFDDAETSASCPGGRRSA